MFLSVIIPTLNEEKCIPRLLEQLSNHSRKDQFEVIVVDGGSTDKTIELVEVSEATLIKAQQASRAHQMNVGADHAIGDVLYFVHADTILVDSFHQDISSCINEGIASGCYRFKFFQPRNPLLHINGFFTRFPFDWCRGGDQTLFILKSEFIRIGGFNEEFVIMEDYEILERLRQNNVEFKILSKSVQVSARKYDENSYLKVQLTNLKAMRMYKRGEDPEKIRNYYNAALNGKYSQVQYV